MGSFIDLTGYICGMLTVVERAPNHMRSNGKSRTMWKCKCDCGNEVVVSADALRRGVQLSCGCYRKANASKMFKTHGLTDSRLYNVWRGLKSRCYNPNVYEYRYYGAKGVKVCDSWRDSFSAFYNWAIAQGYDESAPRGEFEIDRINGSGDYSPDNCRLATRCEQMNNIRTNHVVECNGEKHTLAEWSRITGIDSAKIRNRIERLGWPPERALNMKTA